VDQSQAPSTLNKTIHEEEQKNQVEELKELPKKQPPVIGPASIHQRGGSMESDAKGSSQE